MIRLLAKLFLLAAIDGGSGEPGLAKVRDLYQQSAVDERSCKELEIMLTAYEEGNNPVFRGYRAAAIMVKAKYVFSPFSKLSLFRQGRRLLQRTILANKNNVELHFIRYSIESNSPVFLGYNDDINADKACLLAYMRAGEDPDLKAMISAYFNKKNT